MKTWMLAIGVVFVVSFIVACGVILSSKTGEAVADVPRVLHRDPEPMSFEEVWQQRQEARERRHREQAAREETVIRQKREEIATLHRSMKAFLMSKGLSDRQAEERLSPQRIRRGFFRRRSFPSFADVLIEAVEYRSLSGAWIPLSRTKAPYFLASVAFHEGSLQYAANLRGSRGELCVFQLGTTARWSFFRRTGRTSAEVASWPPACVEAALHTMETCVNRCGDVPAERWMTCYATRGSCDVDVARDVVESRFSTARELIALAR